MSAIHWFGCLFKKTTTNVRHFPGSFRTASMKWRKPRLLLWWLLFGTAANWTDHSKAVTGLKHIITLSILSLHFTRCHAAVCQC